MIQLHAFTYTYPNSATPALDRVSLQIPAGEFVLLSGLSGAGKSTLLRSLSGLVPHFSGGRVSGRIAVAGHDPVSTGPHRLSRVVGSVFQSPEAQAVLDHVEAEIAFGLENGAVPASEMRQRVEEVLSLLELAHLRHRPLNTLSGGERQRVAIAAALALRPQILALDEPTSQLDPQSAREVLNALLRLNQDLGLTVMLAEHRLERVLRCADRVLLLERGRVTVDDYLPQVLAEMKQLPPLATLGRALGWQPLPLTVKAGKQLLRQDDRTGPVLAVPAERKENPDGDGIEPLLAARDLHYAYGRQPALRGVDLTVWPGQVVAILGRNGSGKTTLLKCLVGLLRPQRGDVQLSGRSIRGRDVVDICREVAYLPQNPDDLLFAETVRQELGITLANHGLNGSARADIDALLRQLGLAAHARTYPRDLSVGQRQRVALGAVTITRPRLLLLDEPTRGLDYGAKKSLVALWRQWCAHGMGLVLATHDVELVAQVADQVLILGDGEAVVAGAAREVLPSSPYFAPQIARLFPGRGWLTVADALAGLGLDKVQRDDAMV